MTQPLPSTLYPHQREAVDRILAGAATYLGFDMGLGKTRTAIEAALRRRAQRILVFCPASATLVWRSEVRRWAGEEATVVRTGADVSAGARFTIVSYGHLSRAEGTVVKALDRAQRGWDVTVLDEAHYLKDLGAKRTRAVMKLQPRLGLIIPMSGTPAPNHAGELYPMLAACYPKAIELPSGLPMTRWQFEEAFCVIGSRPVGGGRNVRVVEGSKNLDILRKRIAPFLLRKRKHEVLKDLPPLAWTHVPVGVTESAEIDELTLRLRGLLASAIDNTEKAAILQAADTDIHLMKLRRLLGMAKLVGAVAYVEDMLASLPKDRKVVVFAIHRHVCSGLRDGLAHHGVVMIDGAATPAEREASVEAFLTDPKVRVFVGNIKAAGTALTLVGPTCQCSDVVFVESAWSPADNAQAACRIHRIGQRDAVAARMLYADDTIDEVVADILARKARDFTQLFDTQKEPA